jgi:hypothetical protein
MPNPAGDPKEILKRLSEMDLDSDQTPEEITAQDAGAQDDESKKKASRAWHDLRSTLKVAKGVIEELTKGQEQKPSGDAAPQTPKTSTEKSTAAQAYLDALNTRAMQSTGIYDIDNRLVQMEVSRLYQLDMTNAERTQKAQAEGDKIFDDTVAGFKSFEDSDKAAVKARMAGLSPLDRANPETIKMFVHTYMGENLEKFTRVHRSKPGGDGSSDAAAASAVKRGVGSGDFSVGSGKPPDVKPPTAEELAGMKKLRMPPEKVDVYRRAMAKKEAYMPQ